MKKNNCYPKYSYIIFLTISIILLIFSLGPLIIETNEDIIIKLVWSLFMILFSISMFIGYLWTKQYYEIKDNKIVVKNCFCKINELDLSKCIIQIIELPTYFSWIVSINKKWICFYDNSKYVPKFKSGCSNGRKYKRIQIIFSEDLRVKLSKYIS